MDFLTTKNDDYAKRVCRDFPNVSLILESEEDSIEKAVASKNLYIDERLNLSERNDLVLALSLSHTTYKLLHDIKKGYSYDVIEC